MIRVHRPEFRRFAEALLDIVRKREFEISPGNVLRIGPGLPEIGLLSDTRAQVNWKLAPSVASEEWGLSCDIDRITIQDGPRWTSLFALLRCKPLEIAPGVSLLSRSGRIVPDYEEHDGFLRLTWSDPIIVDIAGVPSLIDPRISNVDLYRGRAEITVAGGPDVTIVFSEP